MKKLKILTAVALIAAMTACKSNNNDPEINETPLLAVNESPAESENTIRVALLLDTSNSMDGLIDQAKAQLWSIVNKLSFAQCHDGSPKLQIALYEYGNDNLENADGFVRQVLPFTGDLDIISKELFSLTTNGGSEYCGTVISKSLADLNWGQNQGDLKLIFIAGNEPFTQGSIPYKSATAGANEKGITVNTIFCGDHQSGIHTMWKDGADQTNGSYMAIDHNQATVQVATPYDQDIVRLNQKLNSTYVYYGAQGQGRATLQAEMDTKAEGVSTQNAVSRTVAKSNKYYKNANWDLVDAVEEEAVSLDEIADSELPKELQGKSEKEIESYVAAKKKERDQINGDIATLNKKRIEYIENQINGDQSALGDAMLNAIQKQASAKAYTWE